MKQGKCTNRSGCLTAYRGEIITASEESFICTECQQPLQALPAKSSSSGGFRKFALAMVGIVFLLGLGLGVGIYRQSKRLTHGTGTGGAASSSAATAATVPPGTSDNSATRAIAPAQKSQAPQPSQPSQGSQLIAPGTGKTSAGVATGGAEAVPAPDLDLTNQANQNTKTEVLKRIDLMPTISEGNKDKLYVSVERARQMGRIVSIPFGSGKTALGAADVEKLKRELQTPAIQKLLQDPTAVFVILGFADTKGDEKSNLRVSQERADSTLRALRDKCGVINVLHAVAMGGSTLFDEKGLGKNRTAEVWVVLP